MSFRDILVYLDPTPACDDRVRAAIALAKTQGARLTGADATSDAAYEGPSRERALQVGAAFEEFAREAGVSCRLTAAGKDRPDISPDLTHCVDLIIAPRPEGKARDLVMASVPDEALLKAGAPVLIIPQEWTPGPIGEHVVIAWNASREATRAVHDALPFLKAAKRVTVFVFSQARSELRAASAALVDHLARHSVKADVSDWTNTGDIGAIDALFASLDTQDADLFVAGAFGHSRAFEGLFGGVSLDLLRQPTIPVLMSH